jgi:Family of unknown function (DUF6182)
MDSPTLLQDALRSHVERVDAGLDGRVATTAGGDRADEASELYVVVVVRDLDPAAFVHGTLEFALSIPSQLRDPWYRTFTRTLFFAGNPLSIAERFECSHLAPGGEIGWLGPAGRRAHLGLRRMLRLFRAPGPAAPPATLELTVPGGPPTGRSATLRMATAGVSTQEYLIHLNHTLCEASLRGLLGPGDALSLSHTHELDPTEARSHDGGPSQLRIAEDARRPGRLRLYASLAADPSPGGARG